MAIATEVLGTRIQPDDRYWAVARQKRSQKTGKIRWEAFAFFTTLEQAATYLLNMTAARLAEEPYDLPALLKAVKLAEAHTVEAVVNATNLPAQIKAMGLVSPEPPTN